MRILIVDDEALARRRLRRLLDEIGDVEVVGESADGAAAREDVRRLRPDVVLLDIHMPGEDGLEVASTLADDGPRVIFTTAHDQHAVAAFERAAVDYLLKPIHVDRLARALDRVRRTRPDAAPPRLVARRGSSIEFFDPREIPCFEAVDGYTAFRRGEDQVLIDDGIAVLERRLAHLGFLRVHRGGLVNVARIQRLDREGDAHVVVLDDGSRMTVSRRRLPELKQRLGLT